MGQSGAQIADIILDDVKIPGDALVGGEEGRGFQIAMQSLDNGRLSVAGMGVGMGRRILDTAVRYATERKAFGEPIANFRSDFRQCWPTARQSLLRRRMHDRGRLRARRQR